MIGAPTDLSKAELRDWKPVPGSGELTQRLELEDGSEIEIRTIVQSVLYLGPDAKTGLPNYGLASTTGLRVCKVGEGVRKAVAPPVAGAAPGFA